MPEVKSHAASVASGIELVGSIAAVRPYGEKHSGKIGPRSSLMRGFFT